MQKYILPPPENITITAAQADALIAAGNPAAALLYLYILRRGGEFTAAEAAVATKLTADELNDALTCLKKLNMVADFEIPIGRRPDEPPEYTASDIRLAAEANPGFRHLIRELENLLGKVFSSGDLTILFGIYDYLGLPVEVILLLARYRSEREALRSGRKPTMRDLEKEAYNWAKLGINSLESADGYIINMDVRGAAIADAKNALRAYNKLPATQETMLSKWIDMGFRADAFEIAYDRTTTRTGNFSWPYADKIICSWHSKGLHSPAEIELGDPLKPPRRPANKSGKPQQQSKPLPPADDELNRMEQMLERQQRTMKKP
jgi:hypothetical protein